MSTASTNQARWPISLRGSREAKTRYDVRVKTSTNAIDRFFSMMLIIASLCANTTMIETRAQLVSALSMQ